MKLSLVQQYKDYTDVHPLVLQYRQAYYELRGHTAPSPGLPTTHVWPASGGKKSYKQKLLGILPTSEKGAELGPLNIPLVPKTFDVLYVDHLSAEDLRKKYSTLEGIVEVDRPILPGGLSETLQADSPLSYVVASQVIEHVPDPIRWFQEVAAVLKTGGRFSLSLPDRRTTFDFYREESRASDFVAAHLDQDKAPNARSAYDHHSQAGFINMPWATPESVTPADIVAGQGKVRAKLASLEHIAYAHKAKAGIYLDVHAWVFTPPSFLLVMAQLALDGFFRFRLAQFYPTDMTSADRDGTSFVAVLEKTEPSVPCAMLRRSFLEPLGE